MRRQVNARRVEIFSNHCTCSFLILLVLLAPDTRVRAEALREALHQAIKGTQASAIVLDLKSDRTLASEGKGTIATPGSTIKPLLLEYALEHGVVTAQAQVFCHRSLRIGTRTLPCTHPADQDVFTAESALAASCNTYFADLGRRYSGAALDAALQKARLPHRSLAHADANGRALTVLGLRGVTVSPRELAEAYRELALSMPLDGPVFHGLADSVAYGMAHAAFITGANTLGKTGTASNQDEAWTHGWFAGIVPGRFVVVVFVPHGDGGTAAQLAKMFLLRTAADRHE